MIVGITPGSVWHHSWERLAISRGEGERAKATSLASVRSERPFNTCRTVAARRWWLLRRRWSQSIPGDVGGVAGAGGPAGLVVIDDEALRVCSARRSPLAARVAVQRPWARESGELTPSTCKAPVDVHLVHLLFMNRGGARTSLRGEAGDTVNKKTQPCWLQQGVPQATA